MGSADDSDKSSRQQELDDLYSNIHDIKDSLTALAGNVANLLRDIVFDYNDKVRERLKDWLTDLSQEESAQLKDFRDKFDAFFNGKGPTLELQGPFGAIGSIMHQGVFDTLESTLDSVFSSADVFGGAGRSPFGLWAKNGPLAAAYDACVKADGAQVWDQRGWWRCLFPNAKVPTDYLKFKNERLSLSILTKDDLTLAMTEANIDSNADTIDLGPKGVFFRHYEGLLKWKQQNWLQVKQQAQQQAQQKAQSLALTWPLSSTELAKTDTDDQPRVVLTLVLLSYTTNPDTNMMEWFEERSETNADGKRTVTTVKRQRPVDGGDWQVVEENTTNDEAKGWFWK